MLTPLAELINDTVQGVSPFSEGVFDAGRDFGKHLLGNEALSFQRTEPLGQRPGADTCQAALEFRETAGTVQQVAQQQDAPAVTDQGKR